MYIHTYRISSYLKHGILMQLRQAMNRPNIRLDYHPSCPGISMKGLTASCWGISGYLSQEYWQMSSPWQFQLLDGSVVLLSSKYVPYYNPQLAREVHQIPSTRDHKALNRWRFRGAVPLVIWILHDTIPTVLP